MPLMAGIVVGWAYNVGALCAVALFAVSMIAAVIGLARFAPRWLFGAGVMLFMFSVGLFVEHRLSAEKAPRWEYGKRECRAHLVEVPSVRGTSVKVLADLSVQCDSVQGRTQGLVYLYFPRSVDSEKLSAGDSLAFEASVSNPKNQGNPGEFDVENYYYIKDITGTAFVPDGKWQLLTGEKQTLRTRALRLRAKTVALYERLGFSGERLALLSALTLGEKRGFPQDLKESYSAAGASHILALSGLHLGILYMLLATLLPLGGRRLAYRLLRELSIVAALWGFAFVAGLSPSVVRAAILFTLMSLGRMIGQDISPVSSLSFAAIVMLLFSPHLLFDISFQLSFAAVLSILLFVPPLQQLTGVYEHGALYGYVMNLLIFSFVAQLGTLPFVWYYFGIFPVYFLLTNLLVVPLAFVVLMLAVAVWVLSPVPVLAHIAAVPLGWAVGFMNWGVCAVSDLPLGTFALPPLSVCGALCVALLMLLIAVSLLRKRRWLFILSSSVAVVLILLFLLGTKDEEKGNYMLIYNNNKNPLLHLVFDGGENYLVSTVPQLDAEYEYVSKPFLKNNGLPAPQWVYWEHNDSLVQCDEGCLQFQGLTVKLLDNGFWQRNDDYEPVDILVLCRGFLGRINKLVDSYPAACVVVDGSLYKRSRERIKREYAELGISVVDISEWGAMKVVATEEGFDLIPMSDKR